MRPPKQSGIAIGDAEVQNVIALSFLYNLESEDIAIRNALGPGLQSELKRMEAWMPDDVIDGQSDIA